MATTRLSREGMIWMLLLGVFGFVWVLMSLLKKNNNTDIETREVSSRLTQLLRRPNVHLSPKVTIESLTNRISQIKQEGPSKFIVVSDFDMTISQYWVNGKRGMTSYCVVDTSSLMPEVFRQEALSLRDRYASVEHNQDLPLEQRVQAMEDWTDSASQLLVKYQLRRDAIPTMVEQANMKLRYGFNSFSSLLSSNHIPLLIFSAGLWDTITEVMHQQGSVTDNVHIVSNRVVYNDQGVAMDYERPVIHSYRKGTIPDHFKDVIDSIKGRHNVLLLGDSLSDTKMANGLDRVDHMIKIGFLNEHENEQLPAYQDKYDIVLTQDANMDVPLSILEAILK